MESLGSIAKPIREGERSATDVVEEHLGRIEARNVALNAVVTLDADGARARAKEIDAAIERDEDLGPLMGVPITIKDSFETEGIRTTMATP